MALFKIGTIYHENRRERRVNTHSCACGQCRLHNMLYIMVSLFTPSPRTAQKFIKYFRQMKNGFSNQRVGIEKKERVKERVKEREREREI
jgi:hypothetical protein